MVVFRDLCKNQLHDRFFPQTKTYTLILQQLIIAFEVFSAAIYLQNEVETWLGLYLKPFSLVIHTPKNVSDELISTGHE